VLCSPATCITTAQSQEHTNTPGTGDCVHPSAAPGRDAARYTPPCGSIKPFTRLPASIHLCGAVTGCVSRDCRQAIGLPAHRHRTVDQHLHSVLTNWAPTITPLLLLYEQKIRSAARRNRLAPLGLPCSLRTPRALPTTTSTRTATFFPTALLCSSSCRQSCRCTVSRGRHSGTGHTFIWLLVWSVTKSSTHLLSQVQQLPSRLAVF
jgi:hypothetical protein